MLEEEKLKEDIFSLLEIENIPPDKQAVILNKAATVVQKRATNRVMDKLSEEQRQEFLDAVEADNPAKYRLVLDNNIGLDKVDEIIQEEVNKIKTQLKKTVDAVKSDEE